MAVNQAEHQDVLGDLPWDDLGMDELLSLARRAAEESLRRLQDGRAVAELERCPQAQSAGDWGAGVPPEAPAEHASLPLPGPGSLPQLNLASEALAHTVTMIQTACAGLSEEYFDQPTLRPEMLWIPAGRTAFRNAPDYLRDLLKIGRSEARRRLRRAHQLMPRTAETTGERLEPHLPVLSAAACAAQISPHSLDLVSEALRDVHQDARLSVMERHEVTALMQEGERELTEHAVDLDTDSLRTLVGRWRQWMEAVINPDGAEPTEAQKQYHQGLLYKGRRHGLHAWLIHADEHQHEILSTVAHAATNPRSPQNSTPPVDPTDAAPDPDESSPGLVPDTVLDSEHCVEGDGGRPVTHVELRSTQQRHLDGVITALQGALSMVRGNGLPASGRQPPQVHVIVDHNVLWPQLPSPPRGRERAGPPDGRDLDFATDPDPPGRPAPRPVCEGAYGGPISATTARTLACDADILPVVLGGEGQVLDLGQSRRLFTPTLRKAVVARDGGCTAPGCNAPAPWCDVHPVQYWEHGGPTSVENGALLCFHHHQAVHAGAWTIEMRHGRPWFIPAGYIDPFRRPLRNRYWR